MPEYINLHWKLTQILSTVSHSCMAARTHACTHVCTHTHRKKQHTLTYITPQYVEM